MPKKIKENNDVDDEDHVSPLSISTITCNTPYNWSAIPLASPDHSYCVNEENMSLPSYSHLAEKTKATKLENNNLEDKMKPSKRPINVLV